MPRIPVVSPDRAGVWTRLLYRFARRRYGQVPEPVAVAAGHRGLLFANAVHEMAVERASTVLPESVRHVAVYRVAWTLGCSWCVDFGAMLHRLAGLDANQLRHIGDHTTSPAFTDDERAAIGYADAMLATPSAVTDDQVTDLRARFGPAGVIELTYHIALESMRSRMYTALGVTEQGFNSGSACRVPWAGRAEAADSRP